MQASKLFVAIVALAAATATLSAADVKETYDKNCAKCHGPDGKGDTKMGKKLEIKDFTDAAYQATITDEKATKAIKEGVKDGDRTRMKAFDDLADEDVKALVAYVRAFKK